MFFFLTKQNIFFSCAKLKGDGNCEQGVLYRYASGTKKTSRIRQNVNLFSDCRTTNFTITTSLMVATLLMIACLNLPASLGSVARVSDGTMKANHHKHALRDSVTRGAVDRLLLAKKKLPFLFTSIRSVTSKRDILNLVID